MVTITYRDVSDINPYAKNPRRNDVAVDAVAESIKEFGFLNPIIIDNKNEVVAGHTRLKAAKKIGLKKVPCILADELNDEQVMAFRIADNKTAEIANWDFELLDIELKSIENIDMEMFGFVDGEISEEVIDSYFEDDTPAARDKHKTITCPLCGGSFEK